MSLSKNYYNQLLGELPKLGEPVNGFSPSRTERLKKILHSLKHHDECYTIMDLRTMSLDWSYGFENALGYNSKSIIHYDILNSVHDDFLNLYMIFGSLAYKILYSETSVVKEPLASRYIINMPIMKKNKSFVWVKQISMPINTDEQGKMVKQMNVYTIIGPYEDIFLPLAPRMFLAGGERARLLEKKVFDSLMHVTGMKLNRLHKKVLKAYFNGS